MYGNFDIVFDRPPHICKLYATTHTPCDVFYLVPRLTGCWLGLVIRCDVHQAAAVNNAGKTPRWTAATAASGGTPSITQLFKQQHAASFV